MELRYGDVLVLFTDGLIEATRDLSEVERVLREVVKSGVLSASVAPAKLIARACLPPRVHDDVAILTVSIGPPPAWTFAAEDARAAVDARTQFVQYLHQAGYRRPARDARKRVPGISYCGGVHFGAWNYRSKLPTGASTHPTLSTASYIKRARNSTISSHESPAAGSSSSGSRATSARPRRFACGSTSACPVTSS